MESVALRGWRTWLGLLGSLLLVPVVVMIAAAPAHACSCAMGETADHVGWADRVFTGEVLEVQMPGVGSDGVQSSADPVRILIAVDEVFKGELPAETTVVTAASGASCGLEPLPAEGESWLWFAAESERGRLGVGLCGGSSPVDERTVAEVVAVTGPGTEAVATGEKPSARSQAVSDTGSGRSGADDAGSGDAVPWGVGGVLVVLGVAVAGAAAVGRRG